MTILARNELAFSSPPFLTEGSSIALSEAKRGDPSSTYFQYPEGIFPLSPGKLVGYMEHCHRKVGLTFTQPFNRHLRQARKLVKDSDPHALVRAVKFASLVAQHPFSLKFVKKVLDEQTFEGLDQVKSYQLVLF